MGLFARRSLRANVSLEFLENRIPLAADVAAEAPGLESGSPPGLLLVANHAAGQDPLGQYIATMADPWIPNPSYNSTYKTVASGNWNDPNVWSTGAVPAASDRVYIDAGTHVVINDTAAIANSIVVLDGAKLSFDTTVHTELRVVTLLVLGELEIGTQQSPVADNVTAKVTFRDVPINTAVDPAQYGNGLLALNSAKVTMHGRTLSDTLVRLASEPRANDTTLTLTQNVNWKPGDQVLLPDTRQLAAGQTPRLGGVYTPQWEELTVAAVNGNVVTLSSPLAYDHLGARDGAGNLDFLPHVAHRSRNVILQSENPAGTRGHTLYQGRSDIDLRYVQFLHLGRTTNAVLDSTTFDLQGNATHIGTNQIARYPVHTHHLIGPATPQANGHQFTLIGNAVDNGSSDHNFKWAITIHGSHYGLIQDNVVYNVAGGAIVTEDGTESHNVFDGNFVMRAKSVGSGWRFSGPDDNPDGREAVGFWFRGPNNYIRNNVATNVLVYDQPDTGYGFKFLSTRLGAKMIPSQQGDNPHMNGTVVDLNTLPILQFENNETYGATESGLTYWYIGANEAGPLSQATETVIKDFKVWNVYNKGVFAYPSNKVVFDGFVHRGGLMGYDPSDYETKGLVIRNSDIQGANEGIILSSYSHGVSVVENTYLRNRTKNIQIQSHFSVNGSDQLPAKSAVIDNVVFDAWPGNNPLSVAMGFTGNRGNLIQDDEVFVYNYDGVSGDDFQVYYAEQAPDYVLPQTSGRFLIGSPVAGLTNQQNWNTYGIAAGGQISPTANTRADIGGFVGRISNRIRVDAPNVLETREYGQFDTFSVYLDTQPTHDVTVDLAIATNEVSLSETRLVFTPQNWDVPQVVTVTGLDDQVQDGHQQFLVQILPAVSIDSRFDALDVPDLPAVNYDDDAPLPTTFDFGVPGSPVQSGYTRVLPNDVYQGSAGFGWVAGGVIDGRDRGTANPLTQDFNFVNSGFGEFAVDLPNGDYVVQMTFGDASFGNANRALWLEDVSQGTVTTTMGQFLTNSYHVSVTDHQLNIRLADHLPLNSLEILTGNGRSIVPHQTISDTVTGEAWFHLTAEAGSHYAFEEILLGAGLELYDSQNNLVTSGTGFLSFQAASSGTYSLRLTGPQSPSNFSLSMPGVVQRGSEVLIFGSDGDDQIGGSVRNAMFTFQLGNWSLITPGSTVSTVRLFGNNGADSLLLTNGTGDDTATLAPGSLSMTGSGYLVTGSGLESIEIRSGGGNDVGTLLDSSGDDRFSAGASYATMTDHANPAHQSYYHLLRDFAQVTGRASGGVDIAYLYDSPASDTLDAAYNSVRMTGPQFDNRAEQFDSVMAHSNNGGNDIATLHGSPFDDLFVGGQTYAYLTEDVPASQASYRNETWGFEIVVANANGAGDRAVFYDSPGDDSFKAFVASARMTDGQTYDNRVNNFDWIEAHSRNGGQDDAELHGSSGREQFVAGKVRTVLRDRTNVGNPGWERETFYFETVTAHGNGGTDEAMFYDSAGDDTYYANPWRAYLTDGATFHNEAVSFGRVEALSRNGGFDTANLVDSALDDRFVAGATFAYFTDSMNPAQRSYYNLARQFDSVVATATNGGTDRATLYDSTSVDLFYGRFGMGRMSGSGFANEARGFEYLDIFGLNNSTNTRNISALDFIFNEYGHWQGAAMSG